MKIISCKVMGEVDSGKCYNCFSNGLSGESFSTRVLCKKNNVTDEMSLSPDRESFNMLEAVAV